MPGPTRPGKVEPEPRPDDAQERELKFSPGPSFRVPDLFDATTGMTTTDDGVRKLSATYFDTDDLRLSRAGASLRHRDDGWTVKLPVETGDALVRRELTVAPADATGPASTEPGGDPPAAARELVLALTRTAPLRAVARLASVRQVHTVRDAQGVALAELVDDEVSVLDGARLVARFREVELELFDGVDDDTVASIVTRLREAGAGAPDPVPKIVRALGPRATEAPDLRPPRDLDFASTARDVLSAAIARSVARLVTHDAGVRLDDDIEDVHQARVATRRLRSDLRTFAAAVDPAWSEPLRDELKWLGAVFGGVRDADVLRARLVDRIDVLEGDDARAAGPILDAVDADRAVAMEALLAALRSGRYLALVDRLTLATHTPPPPPPDASHDEDGDDDDLEPLVRKPWRRLRAAMDALDDDSPDEELHHARILAKRCRYAAEAVTPALGSEARRFAKRIAEIQEVLGDHQDAVVADEWLHAHAPALDPAASFVAGQLVMLEVADALARRAEWPDVWARSRKRKWRRWL